MEERALLCVVVYIYISVYVGFVIVWVLHLFWDLNRHLHRLLGVHPFGG